MPIYEYRCRDCGHELEAIQKISEAVLRDCPACGKPELKKLVSAAGFQLKGGGWYATDFKGNGAGKKKEGETSSDNKSESEAGGKKISGCGSGTCGCAH